MSGLLEKPVADDLVHLVIEPINRVRLTGPSNFNVTTDILIYFVGVKVPANRILKVIKVQPLCLVQVVFDGIIN